MKKKFIIAFLLMAFVIPTVSTALAEQSDKKENNEIKTSLGCADFGHDMRLFSRDRKDQSDIYYLQTFLNKKGYLKTSPTGFFGKATFDAIRAFQKEYGISRIGHVGPMTRAQIKALDCGDKTDDKKNEEQNNQNTNNQNVTKKEVVAKLYSVNKLGEIVECPNNGKPIFIAYANANVGGGTARTYNQNGVLIKSEDTPGAASVPVIDTKNCTVIYLATPNLTNRPGVDVYGVGAPLVQNQVYTVILGTATRLYKDIEYKVTNTNYKITITGFYNHPCPKGMMCIWSGLDVFYKIDPISGKGPSYAKTEINQSTAGFPFTVTIKDSDYTNFAEVVLSNKIDALPGSGDH